MNKRIAIIVLLVALLTMIIGLFRSCDEVQEFSETNSQVEEMETQVDVSKQKVQEIINEIKEIEENEKVKSDSIVRNTNDAIALSDLRRDSIVARILHKINSEKDTNFINSE